MTTRIQKMGIFSYDDKRFYENNLKSYAYGHPKI